METVSPTFSRSAPRAFPPIFWGGLVAGALDITSAFITHRQVIGVLQGVASGLLGADSYKGGLATALLGLILHFFIATVAAAVYYLASRKLRALVERAIIWGALYGIAVWSFMNFIVLPLSAAPFKNRFSLFGVSLGLTVHIILIGLPIALIVRHFTREGNDN